MIQLGKFNPIFFNPRKYKYGTGEYTQRFDVDDFITFEFFSGKGETAQVYLNNLSTGGRQAVDMTTFSLSESVDVHYASLQPGEGYYSVTIGGDVNVESEPFCVCQCKEGTTLLEYSNASNNVDGGVFINGEEKIPFMFRFEGGIKPVDTEYHCDNEYFRNQRQEIRHLYTSSYEVLKLTVGDTSMGCPEWYASFFNKVLNLSDIKIGGETLARSEGSTPEKTQMQEGSGLIYFTINVEADGSTVAGGDGNFNQGGGGGFSVYIITTNDLTEASDKNLFSALRTIWEIENRSLSKQKEDQTNFLLKLLGGIITNNIESEGFTTGALGSGFCIKKDENGDSYLEVDRALFRKTVTFIELLIQSMRHVGGQIMLTPASMHCVRVEEYDTYYRCFFESTDGDRTIAQEFVVNDQARCQTFNIKEGVNENVSNQYYWRLVVGIGDDYIDLSKEDCDAGSTVPKAEDDIVQLGNRTDATRQAAIVLSSYGNDAPYFKLYRGIDSYSLSGKEFVSFSRSEVMIIADSIRMSTGETVKEYIDGALGSLQIGGRNLIPDSKERELTASPTTYSAFLTFVLTEDVKPDTDYVFSVDRSEVTDGREATQFSVRLYRFTPTEAGYASALVDVSTERKSVVLHTPATFEEGEAIRLLVYTGPHGDCQGRTMKWTHLKLEEGTVATGWTPAPEDLENSIVEINEKVDTQFTVLKGEIKSEVSSAVSSLGSAGDNIVKNGNIQESPGYGNPGFIELYKSLVPGDTYTAVLSGELPDGHRFQLCDSGQWEIQGEFELAQGHRIYVLRFTYEPNSQTLEHDKLYLRVEPEDGDPWDLFWICLYEGDVIPPYSFVPAPQEQESGSLDIGVRNLLLNSKLDNLNGWSVNYGAEIVEFDGYKCMKTKGNYNGIYTNPNTGNARLIPTTGKITNSIDVYVTAECDIAFGREGISSNIVHVSEVNKWVRVSNTQELDGQKKSYIIYVTGNTATAYFKDAKCETGTVATGWTPAPEDLKGFDGRNLVVRGQYGIEGNTSYWIRDVFLSQDLVPGKSYTAVLSGNVGGSQRFGLWDSRAVGSQGLFTKQSGRIYTLTFSFVRSEGANNTKLTLHNYPSSGVSANPADVDWLCIYETRADIPQVFVPAPEDDCTLTAWGGHNGAEKSEVVLGDHGKVTQTGRGFHLWKLDVNTMKVTAVGKYDVYATTGDAKTQFVTALNGIGSGYLAIVTSCDAITIDTAIQTALNGYGADAPLMNQSRMSFVLVGKKGIGAGNGVMKLSAVEAVSVSVRIVEGVCRDFFQGGGLAEWKRETRTWIQNTNETISLHAEDITAVEGRVSKAESDITQNAREIELRVKDEDFNGNKIVSRINMDSTTVTIEANKINLVGKVSIGMLDKTIIENDKIKSDLISVNKIEAVEGTISGFEISSDHIGMAEGTAGGPEGLSLYSYRLSIGEPNCRAWIGSKIMSASSTYEAMAGRFEVNKSALGENIGIYISVQGGKAYNDTQDTGNAALHIAKGAIYGTRFRRRSLYASATISVMDTFIVVKNAGVRVTLPSSPEDGQFFFITNRSSGDITFYCASKLYAGNTSAKSSSANLQRGKAAFVYYDTTDSAYHCHWLGNWDN